MARRKKTDDPSTVTALAALVENGLSRTDAGRVVGLTKKQVDEALDSAKLEIGANAAEYARLHLEGVRNAAAKGKTAGIEWALERLGVVKAPEVTPTNAGGGPVIKIGIMLPGLANQPAITTTVEGEKVE